MTDLDIKRLKGLLAAATDAVSDLDQALNHAYDETSPGPIRDMLVCMGAVVRGAGATLDIAADRILFDLEAEVTA